MLDFMHSEDDAINILKKDHDKVKDLFDQFERSDDEREKRSIAAEAIEELKIHTAIEEEIFYPAIRQEQEVDEQLMDEAEEEHHVAKLLIAELDQMDGTEEQFDAKFHVLADSVRSHIKTEEGKIMPDARDTDIDFEALGQDLLDRKQRLMEDGVPISAEEEMISQYGQYAGSSVQGKKRQSAAGSRKTTRRSYSSSNRSSESRTSARRNKR